ncbi:MAG: hypothetical protein DRZ90_14520 [Spirochaetes bacterium]|nr:MAG: hypothetical protein DRZ90_14520 [Spirochaetota bacterium]
MTKKEKVKKAIQMNDPGNVPILFFNRDKEESDLVMIDVVKHYMGKKRDLSEWGFRWESKDQTMGQPMEDLIKSWDDFDTLKIPDPYDKTRFSHVEDEMKRYGDSYYLASLVLSGFTIMTFLRGFTDTLQDLYIDRDRMDQLADVVFGFEIDIIKQIKEYGFDGVAFFDDWGTQDRMIISPELWREFFKPRYKEQFDLIHEYGMDVYFHCCGYINDIIPDLIEIGVDMLNISQPNIFDIEQLGKDYGGKICFVCPVSYQTTSLSGGKKEIFEDVQKLVDHLGCYNGGLIGYVEEYESIGMSEENYLNCVNAFRELGRYN